MNTSKFFTSVRKNYSKIIPAALFAFIIAPIAVYAASGTGLVPCGNPGQSACDFNSLATLINNIINWFLGISVSIAAITFCVAGAKMLLNPTKEAERTAAKDMFMKTIIGMLVILCAWLVIHTVISTLVSPSTKALRFLSS